MMMKKTVVALAGVILFGMAQSAQAAIIFAETIIDYFDSGLGPLPGPYGGVAGVFPIPVDLSVATDRDTSTALSLPLGSFITLGFSGGFVFDGIGNDIFVSELGGADELADVFISSDFGSTFSFLGQATTATISGFDLSTVGFTDTVNAVKVVGADLLGGSPGFDLSFVQGLEGSVVITTPSTVPVPDTLLLVITGLIGFGWVVGSRRRRQNHYYQN